MPILKKKDHYKRWFVLGMITLFVTIAVSSNFGAADISIKQTILIILSKVPIVGKFINLSNAGIKSTSVIILLKLRLPRIILACIVGSALSVTGTSYQGVFKNPMADPYILGISSGAALGATLTMVFGIDNHIFGMSIITINAFIGAIITMLIVYNIARIGNKIPSSTLLLAGISLNFLLSSLISIAMTFKREDIEKIIMWTMGSFSLADWREVIMLLIIVIPCIILTYFFSKDLNIMLLGEDSARSLGVDTDSVKKYIIIISTIMIAAVVSVSGIIGFAGLIIPHAVRMLFGSDHKVVIPFSALLGSIFLIICDTISRSIVPPSEIPVGIITSIFGVPFFIYLLYKTKKKVL